MGSDHFLVARELDLRQIERGFCLRKRGLRGIDLRLVGTRIDYKQKLPLAQVFAVLKMALDDAAADLRRHRD